MKKIYYIVNIHAGKAEISQYLGEIIDKFNKAGFEVTVHISQSGDDAAECAKYACENEYDMLVCSGGDGTLSQCVQGLMRSSKKIPVGYIPAGSTNDFARTLNIPKTTFEAVDNIICGTPVSCDIGGLNDEYFTYIAAFGAFTNVTYETSQQVKNVIGHSAYILSGMMQLTSIKSKRLRIEYDDIVIEDDFIFGMVTNTSSVAGLLSMKDFLLDDGAFEVTLIKKPANIMQLQSIIHSLLNIKEQINKEYIKFFRTNKIKFTSVSGEPLTWTRDGEYGGDSSVSTIFNYNKAVDFIIDTNKHNKFSELNPEQPQLF